MPTVKELHAKRTKAIADARAIDQKVTKEKRSMTAEERQEYVRFAGEARSLKEQIAAEEQESSARAELDLAESEMEEVEEPRAGRDDPEEREGDDDGEDERPARRGDRDRRHSKSEPRGGPGRNADTRPRTLRYRLASGKTRSIQISGRRASEEYREAYGKWLRTGRVDKVLVQYGRPPSEDEERDLVVENDTQAGYLVAPQQMAAGMIRAVDDQLHIRQYATVLPLTQAKSLGAVSLDADPEDGEWTAECETGTADSSMKFGKRVLNPSRLSKRIVLGNELLMMTPDIEALVIERLSYKMAVTQEKNFILGDGNEKPLGLMVASNDGIPTSRDISTGNTATELKPDNLIRAKQNVKPQYRRNGVWLFHTDALTQVMIAKDANGQYMWRPGITATDPDTLLNRPVLESVFMPNTFTSGKYVGLFGDLSHYWIAEAMAMRFQRSTELYILQDKTLIIVRAKLDGMPTLAEAFTRLKLG